jgi:hypothetical protein
VMVSTASLSAQAAMTGSGSINADVYQPATRAPL